MTPSPLFDAHNHLHDAWLAPHHEDLLRTLPALGLHGAVVNGTTPEDWPAVEALCARADWLIPSYGVHPWDCGNRPSDWFARLEQVLLSQPRAAVGEIGLDRWILERAAPDDARLAGLRRAPLDEQADVFTAQLRLAARLGRPASVHCLDAFGPLLELLRATPLPAQGFLLHAYSGPAELVPSFAQLGAYFSFNGAFLDPRKKRARAAFAAVPADRLLVETDAPAMPLPGDCQEFALPPSLPGGHFVNHPGNIRAAYVGLAQLKGCAVHDLCSQCSENFRRLFS